MNVELLAIDNILLNCKPAVTRKMADLKDEILSKIDQKFNKLKLEFLSELKDQIKRGFWS